MKCNPIYCGQSACCGSGDIIPQNKISPDYRYIEKLPTITLNEIIADTKWISATYRIFGFSVKP